jgi:hypothetical protein
MNISGLNSGQPSGVSQVYVAPDVSSSSIADADSSSGSDGSATTQISPRAQFLAKLGSLEQTNPVEAKQVLSQMATQLNQRAQGASGDEAQALSAMASKLQAAANTGDLSVLSARGGQNSTGGQGGSNRRSGGGAATSGAAAAYVRQSQSSRMSLLDLLNSDLTADNAGQSLAAGAGTGTDTTA